jgi:hypothetical protein
MSATVRPWGPVRRTAAVVVLAAVTAFAGLVFPFVAPLRAVFQRSRGATPPAARTVRSAPVRVGVRIAGQPAASRAA